MPNRKLPNYLRACRKRAALSQEDLAFLLGCESGTKVSRYELFRRQPTLSTVCALEAIFGEPARELFAGVYEAAERQAAERARQLLDRVHTRGTTVWLSRKVALLSRIATTRSDSRRDAPRRV